MDVTKNRSQQQIKNGDIILVHFPTAWYLWTLMLRLWTIQRLQSRGGSRTYKGFDGYAPMMASHITSHARRLIMGLGKSNVWRHIFADFCRDNIAVNA